MEQRMKGILKWSLQQQADGTAQVCSMDAERQEWLKEALQTISSQPTEMDLLKAALTVLKAHTNRDSVPQDASMADLKEHQLEAIKGAFKEIQYFVEDLDHANDLIPLGGVPVIMDCLQDSNNVIIRLSCELIATATQNNPKSQEAFLSSIPRLLDIVQNTNLDDELRTKALYALSCLSREYELGLLELLKHDGFTVLLQCVRSSVRKCVIKSLFMFMSFYSPATGATAQGSLKKSLPVLVTELTAVLDVCEDVELLEHMLSTLSTLLTHHRDEVEVTVKQSELKEVLCQKRSLLLTDERKEQLKLLEEISAYF